MVLIGLKLGEVNEKEKIVVCTSIKGIEKTLPTATNQEPNTALTKDDIRRHKLMTSATDTWSLSCTPKINK